jgi:uncharacterized protein (DUF2062 family)
MTTWITRIAGWAQQHMPKREELEHNRWIRPFARRPELWRFTRRSVPRGVAVGLLVGIFALIPGVQIIGAALMCVPSRGNIPIAALMTFLSNPATTPLILLASIRIGNGLGFHADLTTFQALYERGAGLGDWAAWLLSDAAPAMLLGLFVISTIVAAVGYLVASFGWNWWVRHKRRVALERLRASRATAGSDAG